MKIILVCYIMAVIALALISLQLYLEKKSRTMHERHFCNHCKQAFINSKEELNLTVCPDCGKPLTLHEQDPDYIPFDDEEQK